MLTEASRLIFVQLRDFNQRRYQHELKNKVENGDQSSRGKKIILGEMGYGRSKSITAIGDTVNTASRFESLTKEYLSQLIFSQESCSPRKVECGRLGKTSGPDKR